jgi:hypothetical protein
MKVVLRETKEARLWLRIIIKCKLQQHACLGKLPDEARQLTLIFAAIVRNVSGRLERQRAEKRASRTFKRDSAETEH